MCLLLGGQPSNLPDRTVIQRVMEINILYPKYGEGTEERRKRRRTGPLERLDGWMNGWMGG